MNQILPLLLIAGAAYYFWPQIQTLLSGAPPVNPGTGLINIPTVPMPTNGVCPSGYTANIGGSCSLESALPHVSILPQPGQYGISQTLQPSSVQIVTPPAPTPLQPVQPKISLQDALKVLQNTVVPPAVDVPPYGVIYGLPAATWNAYLLQLTGVKGPDASQLDNPNAAALFASSTPIDLNTYWTVAQQYLGGHGYSLSGLSGWYV
jgi:hypothetical protein